MLRTVILSAVLAFATAGLTADDKPPDLESLKGRAIVVVTAKAIDAAHGNVPVSTQGTGFFISSEGILVTSYHLRSKLGAIPDNEIAYEVRFGASPGDPVVPASVFWPSEAADLLVLYVAIGDHPISVLPRSALTREAIQKNVTQLYVSGYPNGVPFLTRRGVVLAFGLLDARPGWVTDLSFIDGLSGSPVCLADGSVIAVAKGNDAANPAFSIIVPIKVIPNGYWDK